MMGPIAKELSTFITPFGQYRWKRMPFGFKTAPACFQRVMNFVLKDLLYVSVLVYLDDVICWADSLEEMEIVIVKVVDSL